jgi:thymidylate synthase ThyX
MGERLDGKIAALTIKEDLKKAFNEGTRKACLAIICFDDPASESYLKGRLKIAEELGITIKTYTFDEKDEVLLRFLIDNKHLTPLEHVKFQFSVHCPLFVRGQWHRHRAGWSYNEISRRYTEVDMEFYIPENFRIQSDLYST